MISNIWLAFVITLVLALGWLRLNDFFASRGWVSVTLSRKIIHMGTGPIFVLCWLLFPQISASRYLAALIPLAITAQFALVGLGIIHDQAAVDAMSRTGDRREILRGPLYYGIVFVILTIVYWRDSLIGIIALMLMCGGDALADILGRRARPTGKLPWSKRKSWLGSLGMFMGGWLFAVAVTAVYLVAGHFSGSLGSYLIPITIIAFIGTLIESLPFQDIDNITVTVSAVIIGHLLGL